MFNYFKILLFMFIINTSFASMYVGIGVGGSDLAHSNQKGHRSLSSYNVVAGYNFNDNLSLEFSYADLGKDKRNYKYNYTGVGLIYIIDNADNEVDSFVGAGMSIVETNGPKNKEIQAYGKLGLIIPTSDYFYNRLSFTKYSQDASVTTLDLITNF